MEKNSIGRFLKQLRTEKGLTQKQVAKRLAVTDKTISRWERGENPPDLESLGKLAVLFSVSEAELVSGGRFEDNDNKKKIYNITPSVFFFDFFITILAVGITRPFMSKWLKYNTYLAGLMLKRYIAVMALSAVGRAIMKIYGKRLDKWLETRQKGKSKKSGR